MTIVMRFLVWLGLVRRYYSPAKMRHRYRWPLKFAPRHCWSWKAIRAEWRMHNRFYVFRNLPGVIKWKQGRLLPRRWGVGILGLIEFGDRG